VEREAVGPRLKRLRLERRLSQRELACPGVSYAYISRIEAGTRQPSVKALRKLARTLNVTTAYLETGSDIDDLEERELRLADAELALRLGDAEVAEGQLRRLFEEAVAAGDQACAARARIALAPVSKAQRERKRSELRRASGVSLGTDQDRAGLPPAPGGNNGGGLRMREGVSLRKNRKLTWGILRDDGPDIP